MPVPVSALAPRVAARFTLIQEARAAFVAYSEASEAWNEACCSLDRATRVARQALARPVLENATAAWNILLDALVTETGLPEYTVYNAISYTFPLVGNLLAFPASDDTLVCAGAVEGLRHG